MIENRQGGKTSETLLLSHQARPNLARKQQDQRALRINNQASIDLGMLQHARPDYDPAQDCVERYIAVPISATEQYLISSTGQTYLTEKLASPVLSRRQEPGERLPPIGALSRTTSKISLDLPCNDEETQC